MLFSLVHYDVWGPAPDSHNNQFQYFLLFVDDFSRMKWVYFLKHKFEVPDKFYAFYQIIHTQFGKKIQVLKSIMVENLLTNQCKSFSEKMV